MSIIRFEKANCRNCYKCIRYCPVKAIAFKDDRAEIVEQDCMLCGICLEVCPQNARTVRNDIDIVKKFIKKKEKVYVSLAPSFVSAFENVNENWMLQALRRLGFTYAEETAVGALQVSRQYERLLQERKMKNIITTACPSVNLLIQKYYPELVDQMAPIVSPMIAHGKMLRETYGSRIRVVFIGPCISKKEECGDPYNHKVIDAVLSFEDLEKWMLAEGIYDGSEFSEDIKLSKENPARIYPVTGGILKTIDGKYKKNYRCVSIDGVENCIKTLDSLKNDGMENYFIEMNSCYGGCIGGPCMRHIRGGYLEARARLIEYVRKNTPRGSHVPAADCKIDFSREYTDRSNKYEIPSEATIQGILNSIGKFTKDKELNCGACGYPSCRDKAIAVYNKKAQLRMCLPYMKERAESISNLVISNSPKAVFALDSELRIQELNKAAREMFGLVREDMEGVDIHEVLDCDLFETVLQTGESINDEKYYYEAYDLTVEQAIVYIPEHQIVVVTIKDISAEERKSQHMLELRSENVDIAQKLIEKQMRVAQEIASLLGETTAETKVALTKLKKSIMAEMSDKE